MNGPKGNGSANPRISDRNDADAFLSRAGMIVWFSWTVIVDLLPVSCSVGLGGPGGAQRRCPPGQLIEHLLGPSRSRGGVDRPAGLVEEPAVVVEADRVAHRDGMQLGENLAELLD